MHPEEIIRPVERDGLAIHIGFPGRIVHFAQHQQAWRFRRNVEFHFVGLVCLERDPVRGGITRPFEARKFFFQEGRFSGVHFTGVQEFQDLSGFRLARGVDEPGPRQGFFVF